MKVKRITYLYEDEKTYKQIEGEELEKFIDNFERAHMFAALHGYDFKPVDWEVIELNYDKKLDTQVWN